MDNLSISFSYNGSEHALELAFIAGTPANDPFLFGDEQPIHIPNFFIATTQTTQALWKAIMDDEVNHSQYKDDNLPVEHVSWNDINQPGGFLEKLNEKFATKGTFRLPAETEWEYAARGGQHWRDGFRFAGTNDMAASG